MSFRMANSWQVPSFNTEYTGNIGYQGFAQYQGPMPQYPYFMSPTYNFPPNNGNVLPSLVYPPNIPPPYPPH